MLLSAASLLLLLLLLNLPACQHTFCRLLRSSAPPPPAVCSRPFAVPHIPLTHSYYSKRTWRLIDRDIYYYYYYICTRLPSHISYIPPVPTYTQATRGSRDNPEFINSALCAQSRGGHTNNNIIIVLYTADLCSVWNCEGHGRRRRQCKEFLYFILLYSL